MNLLSGVKVGRAIVPASVNGAATAVSIDISTAAYCLVLIQGGNISANDFTVAKVQGSDDDSTYADLSVDFIRQLDTTTTSVSASSLAWTLTSFNDGDNLIWAAIIDTRKVNKKYIKLAVTTGGASLISAMYVLLGLNEAPNTNTERGTKETLLL